MRKTHNAVLLGMLSLMALSLVAAAQADQAPEPVRPLPGALMLAGHGDVPDCAIDAFLDLCGGAHAHVAVVSTKSTKPRSLARWRKHGASSVVAIGKKPRPGDQLALDLLKVDGVWFEDQAIPLVKKPLFKALVRGVLERGGAVGGAGQGALALVRNPNGKKESGLDLLPRSRVVLLKKSDRSGKARKLDAVLAGG